MDMFWIWVNPIGRENATEEGKLSLLELALAKLQPKVLGMQTSENLVQKRVMLLDCLSIDENVINVHSHALQISQGVVNELLTDSPRVNQSEWKPSVLMKPKQSKHCSEHSAVGMQLNVMECLHKIQLGEEL